MILDLQTMFSGAVASDGTKTGQAVTATAISTNVLDLRNASTPTLVDEGAVGEDLVGHAGVCRAQGEGRVKVSGLEEEQRVHGRPADGTLTPRRTKGAPGVAMVARAEADGAR